MDLQDYRKEIDAVDRQLTDLFAERMRISGEIARYKKTNGIRVTDPGREREKLFEVGTQVPEEFGGYAKQLFSVLFDLSRSYQNRLNREGDSLTAAVTAAIRDTPQLFPQNAFVACQGVEGANAQIACDKLFRNAHILYFSTFDAVFTAIEKGLCRYGVIPVENSTAGTVNSVYDLMLRHRFYVVRSIRLKVDHNLLALPGTRICDLKEIYSHEQAISQCAEFLKTLPGVKIIPCENTAVAAKMVSDSGRRDVAALSSRLCMKYYGLECLQASVQDQQNNYTRFICISRSLEIYPGADRTSLMLTLPHEPGSLYRFLSRLYALDINLNKLESRPIPDREFEFMFYFDLDTPVYSPAFLQLLGELPAACDEFHYLGSYSEVI
ncbi:MAG: chorismate mutase [Lachnospiraceae bacterium]|nr:chorismate mutase [Lachnospiraceae bacterium]MBP5254447.1 chorismate mutase [Lachnospiraceae bacterium]